MKNLLFRMFPSLRNKLLIWTADGKSVVLNVESFGLVMAVTDDSIVQGVYSNGTAIEAKGPSVRIIGKPCDEALELFKRAK